MLESAARPRRAMIRNHQEMILHFELRPTRCALLQAGRRLCLRKRAAPAVAAQFDEREDSEVEREDDKRAGRDGIDEFDI